MTSWRSALVTTFALLGAAASCTPATPRAGAAADDGWDGARPAPPPRPSTTADAGPPPSWERAGELAGLRAVAGRSHSQHFGAELERTVLANGGAAGYGSLADGSTMPVGALVVQPHFLPGSDEVVAYYVMEKKAAGYAPEQADWELLVLDPSLRVRARGRLPLCARCHQLAPNDGLFGPGRPPSTKP